MENRFLIKKDENSENIVSLSQTLFGNGINLDNSPHEAFFDAVQVMMKATAEMMKSEEIFRAAAQIAHYVENVNSENSEMQQLFGFVRNVKKTTFDEWREFIKSMDEQARGFFLSDLKIKSAIFYLRAQNFERQFMKQKVTIEGIEKSFMDISLSDALPIAMLKLQDKVKDAASASETTGDNSAELTSDDILFGTFILGLNKDKSEFVLDDKKTYDVTFWIKGKEISGNAKDCLKDYLDVCRKFLETKDNSKKQNIAKSARDIEQNLFEELYPPKDNPEDKPEDENNEKLLRGMFGEIGAIGLDDTANGDLLYYLFDNSMNEVQFFGMSYCWRWRYVKSTANLFRCVGTNKFTVPNLVPYIFPNNFANSGREYYKSMIREVVRHMNKKKQGEKNKLSSYSKNPWQDIYKYMGLPAVKGKNEICLSVKNDSEENSEEYSVSIITRENNTNTCVFAMVKNSPTNIVKRFDCVEKGDFSLCYVKENEEIEFNCACGKSAEYSFSQMINNDILPDKTAIYGFCIDVLNNSAPDSKGDIRGVFQRYTDCFKGVDVVGLQRNIVASSDEEVIMLGNTCDEIINLPKNGKYLTLQACKDNVEYRVTLNFEEIVGLFWRMAEKVKNKGTNSVLASIPLSKIELIETDNGNGTIISGLKIFDILEFELSVFELDKKKFAEALAKWLSDNAEKYAKNAKPKLDFIMSFMGEKRDYSRKSIYITEDSDKLLNLYRFALLGQG